MGIFKYLRSLASPDPPPEAPRTEPGTMVFRLDPIEQGRLERFREHHKETCPGISTIGGKFTYVFTPTGIGTAIVVRCNACGKEEDITNIDAW